MLELQQQAFSDIHALACLATWSVFTALLSLFLDFTFREKNIFEGWLNFWANRWLSKNKPAVIFYAESKTDDEIKVLTSGEHDTVREYKHDKVEWFWWKPLGGCVVCMNVWISFFFMLFFGASLFEYLFYILLSNFLVRFFHEKLL